MTIERINAILGTNFTLTKRNGMPNEGNIRIMSRLHDITEAEIERFKREDEGWNWTSAEKHARGYHALRALDKWYRENGHGSGSDGTEEDRPSGSGMPIPNDEGSDTEGDSPSNGNGNSSGNDGEPTESNGADGDSGSNESDSGDSTEEGTDGESNGGSGEADGSDDGDGDSEGDSPEEESKPDDSGTTEEDSNEPDNRPSEKLTKDEEIMDYIITTPRSNGQPNNLYNYGPAGSGKSFGARELARKKGYGYWETGMFTMKEELLGFKTASGEYAETEFVRILKHGMPGKDIVITLFDEFDGNSNDVTLPFNNIFASRRFTTPEGTFDVHPSVRFVATGNTTMGGSDEDYDRETADKSVKTRWLFHKMSYDKNIEKKLADKETVRFLQGLRKAKDNIGLDLMVTYREFTALDWAEKAIENGIFGREEALDTCVFKGFTEDDKDTLRNDAMMRKLIDEGNRWALAL